MNNLRIYTFYHKPEMKEEFNLVDDDIHKNIYIGDNTLNPYFGEVIGMINLYKSNAYKDCDYIGFQHPRRQWNLHRLPKRLIHEPLLPHHINQCVVQNIVRLQDNDGNLLSSYDYLCINHTKAITNTIIKYLGDKYGKGNKYIDKFTSPFFIPYNNFIMRVKDFERMMEFVMDIIQYIDDLLDLQWNPNNIEAMVQELYAMGDINNYRDIDYQRRLFGFVLERITSIWIMVHLDPITIPYVEDKYKINEQEKKLMKDHGLKATEITK